LLALAAILALAVGTVLRRSTAAVAGVIVLVLLPYLLAVSVLPPGAAEWVLRCSPAAAFAIQQSAIQWPQVDNVYTPAGGYFPLSPAAGLGVLVLWTAVALVLATVLFRRRDA
jgi:ABC-type transport system involved in multi-copper enzyme maturation permease subunit